MNNNSGCVFCEGNRFYYHKLNGLRYDNAVIYEDENIYISPDISPVIKGHYLIITKKHILGYANAEKSIIDSLNRDLTFLKENVYERSDITYFEHGTNFEKHSGASIDHAHMHVIPGIYDLFKSVEVSKYYDTKNKYTQDYLWSIADKYSYLWITLGDISYIYTVRNLPRQFLRLQFSKIHQEEYTFNWKEEHSNELSIKKYFETLDMCKVHKHY